MIMSIEAYLYPNDKESQLCSLPVFSQMPVLIPFPIGGVLINVFLCQFSICLHDYITQGVQLDSRCAPGSLTFHRILGRIVEDEELLFCQCIRN